jgi:hypothetical protein
LLFKRPPIDRDSSGAARSGFGAHRAETSPRTQIEIAGGDQFIDQRLHLSRNIGLHLKANDLARLHFSGRGCGRSTPRLWSDRPPRHQSVPSLRTDFAFGGCSTLRNPAKSLDGVARCLRGADAITGGFRCRRTCVSLQRTKKRQEREPKLISRRCFNNDRLSYQRRFHRVEVDAAQAVAAVGPVSTAIVERVRFFRTDAHPKGTKSKVAFVS